jgi:hypothetical protein
MTAFAATPLCPTFPHRAAACRGALTAKRPQPAV